MQELYNTKPKKIPRNDELVFGQEMTDHMMEVHWSKSRGWGPPTVDAYHPLTLDPAAKCLHYAVEVPFTNTIVLFECELCLCKYNVNLVSSPARGWFAQFF